MLTDRDWQEPHSHMFIMRIWAEELGDGKQEWRGKLQHSQGGSIQYFRELGALGSLVEAMLAEAATAGEPPAVESTGSDGLDINR